ncbi:DUF4476 domain-containing protein [Pyxidicoccus parkwayensis]|uniref:DUF4476 domain-containing protein n=1 Tax=Pyxidicoccus parkwayensis TaxID=2813578 RepID=A0ABX7NRJ7_9BACT|nr:DUF4476 domain-containing protein [Pyxidicoccus parkwaysis]QSQ20026.1 DUF4476 domain-containing protein [Pyxidicoccus parkwaysis]
MNHLTRALLASTLFLSSAAFAQDAEMNMNIQVDDSDMPSANIQVKGMGPDGETQGVDMKVQAGGARVGVEMNVQGGETRSSERVERHERHERRERREEPRYEEPQAMPARAPAYEPAFRDCGTGEDSGCTTRRDGQFAMDAETFSGVMKSLKSTANELTREEMAEKMFRRNYLTAKQFGQVLDLFKNELTRLDVAKNAAPHVVNPQHALGFSSKWKNSLTGDEYVEVMTAQ